jgi:exopolysaccharide biosynthesis polyprenyl glycosylphosphotransferase
LVQDAIPIAELVSIPVETTVGISETRSELRRSYSASLEGWVGRGSICWLSVSVPLLASDMSLLHALRLATPVALIWFLVAVAVEQSSPDRRPAFGPVARVLWRGAIGLIAVLGVVASAGGAAPSVSELLVASAAAVVAGIAWEARVARAETSTMAVLIVGGGPGAVTLARTLAGARSRCELAGIVCDEPVDDRRLSMSVLGSVDALAAVVAAVRPRVLAVGKTVATERVFGALAEVVDEEVSIVGLEELQEFLLGRLPVRDVDFTWLMSALHLYRRPYGRLTKRVFDILLAVVGLVLTAPLMGVVALALRQTGGTVLYRQIRQGQRNEPFTILKFRTMRDDAELDGTPVWAIADDPRVTRLGRMLRRTRIDELPQLWNVLTGTMSIVGPRPERPEYFAALSENMPLWSLRTLLKPGITGWAQINSGYAADVAAAETKLSYDLWYLRHRSLLVDAAICARTVFRLGVGSR